MKKDKPLTNKQIKYRLEDLEETAAMEIIFRRQNEDIMNKIMLAVKDKAGLWELNKEVEKLREELELLRNEVNCDINVMVEEWQIWTFLIVFIVVLVIAVYIEVKGWMTAELALFLCFAMIGFGVMWFWGIDKIYISHKLRQAHKRYG